MTIEETLCLLAAWLLIGVPVGIIIGTAIKQLNDTKVN